LRVYADSSFLVSLYSTDANSAHAAAQMTRLRGEVVLTALAELELTNAFQLHVFRKEATETEISRAQAKFEEHVRDGVFTLLPLSLTVYENARQIARKRTAYLGCRTLDILHVVSALLLQADRFWTFDQRQASLARAEGLRLS
jgi:predicted nucleic acid-binding protein